MTFDVKKRAEEIRNGSKAANPEIQKPHSAAIPAIPAIQQNITGGRKAEIAEIATNPVTETFKLISNSANSRNSDQPEIKLSDHNVILKYIDTPI